MAFLDRFRGKNKETLEEKFVASSGGSKDRFIEELAEEFKEGTKHTKAQKEEKRIDVVKLHKCYRLDETVFRCVNFYAQQVVGPDFYFVGDENAVKLCEDFKDRTHLLLKLEDIVRDQCIYGHGWMEIMQVDGKLANVAYVDARCMDFQRDNEGYVLENSNGKAEGYRFKRVGEVWYNWNNKNGLTFTTDEIAYFPLFGHENELAYGYIEPLYHTIYDKLNVKQGLSQSGWRAGFPLTVAYIGDKPDVANNYGGHKCSEDQVSKTGELLEDIQSKHKLILPFYTKVEQLKAEKTEFQPMLEYFDKREGSEFGIPLEMLGMGSASKASIEAIALRDLDRTLKNWQTRLSIVMINSIFTRYCNENGVKVPKIVWRETTTPDLNRAAKRRVDYVNAFILSPEEVRDIISKEEGITLKEVPERLPPTLPFGQKQPPKEIQKESLEDIIQRVESGAMSVEEAILLLKKMRESFPTNGKLIDQLIKDIMLNATGITVPTETGGLDKPNEGEANDVAGTNP